MDKKVTVIGYVCILAYLTVMEALGLIGYVSLSVGVIVSGLLAGAVYYDRSNDLAKELHEVRELKKEVGTLRDRVSGILIKRG